jgi:hypothetical protein
MPAKQPKDKIWISATELRNYMIRDPILDWLKINFKKKRFKKWEKRFGRYKKVLLKVFKSEGKTKKTLNCYLFSQGHEFEKKVVERIKQKVGIKNFLDLDDNQDPKCKNSFEETVKAIKTGIPVIHGGVLHNEKNNTYGVTDLIVRSDYFGKLFKKNPLTSLEVKIAAPILPEYHYRIIDIKFSSLPLRADGIHLLNSKHVPSYKGQLWVYNEALSNLQGYNPKKSYILGRKWSYESCKDHFHGDSCFDRLGVIDYEGVDSSYCLRSEKAIEWMRDVKSPESKNWVIDEPPLTRNELYPNMSNCYDNHWREVKYEISEKIKEMTSIWMVGTKQRELAHEKGVYKWTDKNCNSKTFGMNGETVGRIVDEILKTNRGKKIIRPDKIKNNVFGWKKKRRVEFFVDFETLGSMFTEFNDIENDTDKSFIFMIGVGHVDRQGDWDYKSFVCKERTPKEEIRICAEFTDYIVKIAKSYRCKDPKCFHWSGAERHEWDRFFERHRNSRLKKITAQVQSAYYWEWSDLLDVFKTEPITIKGCFNFSLKSVAKSMHRHGMIDTIWDNKCVDGKDAMMIAWDAYKDKNPLDSVEMKSVIEYNEVDVKVLMEIVDYLRKNKIEKRK